jgi:hypothetical protein
MAVRTQHCLKIITVHSIPFAKRTIWLLKTLALIVGVGGRSELWSKLVCRGFLLLVKWLVDSGLTVKRFPVPVLFLRNRPREGLSSA